jgi:hypothetical protein
MLGLVRKLDAFVDLLQMLNHSIWRRAVGHLTGEESAG